MQDYKGESYGFTALMASHRAVW